MAEENKTQKVKALKVRSSQEGFRRAGHVFGKEPVTIPVADLKSDQVKALKAEPLLTVSETTIEVAAE